MGKGSKAAASAIQFTLDPTPVTKGLLSIAKSTARTFKLLAAAAIAAGSYFGIKGLLKYMPETQQSLQVAGDIAMNNFVWPLRQALLPLLNKLLLWVRDSRGLFVSLGAILVNVFKATFAVLKVVFDLVKALFRGFLRGIGVSSQGLLNTISGAFNLFLAKVTIIAILAQAMLEPIFETIGVILGYLTNVIGQAFAGIFENIHMIIEPFQVLGNKIRDTFNKVEDGKGIFDEFGQLARSWGRHFSAFWGAKLSIIGTLVGWVIDLAAGFMHGLTAVGGFTTGLRNMYSKMEPLMGAVMRLARALGKVLGPAFHAIGAVVGQAFGVVVNVIGEVVGLLAPIFTWIFNKAAGALEKLSETGEQVEANEKKAKAADEAAAARSRKITKEHAEKGFRHAGPLDDGGARLFDYNKKTEKDLKTPVIENKKQLNNNKNYNVSITNNVSVSPTSGVDAREAGERYSEGVTEQLNKAFLEERLATTGN